MVTLILGCYLVGLNLFRRNAFNKTEIELKLMAAAANIGFSFGPPDAKNSLAANGIPAALYANAQNKFCFIKNVQEYSLFNDIENIISGEMNWTGTEPVGSVFIYIFQYRMIEI